MSLHAVIMAGGAGTRFWPASRAARPKQLLPLAHGRLLVVATVERLAGLCAPDHVWIVTNRRQVRALMKALPGFRSDRILVEPEPRDTAPCIALAAARLGAADPGATMVVLPADHVIEPVDAFQRLVRRGAQLAADGKTLVTFGVSPSFAATGYGYIERGPALDDQEPRAHASLRFCEKPDADTARRFVERGLLWNSGIFVWTVPALRAAFAHAEPALAAAAEAMFAAAAAGQKARLTRAFKAAPKVSIDRAVMEKAPTVAVVEAAVRWHDVGSFPAIAAVGIGGEGRNFALLSGGASWLTLQSEDNVVYAEGKRTVALFGVRDLVVVALGDAVLVCPKDRAAELKELVEHVRAQGRTDLL
jgi:mannose-1-phosphate guanylyltransferase